MSRIVDIKRKRALALPPIESITLELTLAEARLVRDLMGAAPSTVRERDDGWNIFKTLTSVPELDWAPRDISFDVTIQKRAP